MELSEYVKISESFKEDVYLKYMNHYGDPEMALSFVDQFLKDYPFYPEALLFKARMLIALSREKEALAWLEACEKFERWGVVYKYDKAEVIYRLGQKSEAVSLIKLQVETSVRDILEGIENFLLGIDFDLDGMNHIRDMMKREIILYLSKESDSLDFKNIIQILKNHQILSEEG